MIYSPVKINKIQEIANTCDQDTLVVWDVDGVLLISPDRIFHSENIYSGLTNKYIEYIANKYNLTKEQEELFISDLFIHRPIKLVEDGLLDIIKRLQFNNIKNIALTHCEVGTLGRIQSVADWRINDLAKLGIKFDNSFQNFNYIELNKLDKINGNYPLYKQGVLFCLKPPKGIVLGAFLDQIEWRPMKIVFIDDKQDNLESLELELQQRNIEFVGLHYTGALDLPKEINEKVVKLQFEHLINQEEWLNDQKALQLLN